MTQDDLRLLNSLVDIELEAALKKRELIQGLMIPGLTDGFPVPDQHQSAFPSLPAPWCYFDGVEMDAGMHDVPPIIPAYHGPPAADVTEVTNATGDTDGR